MTQNRIIEELQEKFQVKLVEKLQKEILSLKQNITSLEEELETVRHQMHNGELQLEERDAEIRKAQQHLAKKMKESTILHDLVERQKVEIAELHKKLEQLQK